MFRILFSVRRMHGDRLEPIRILMAKDLLPVAQFQIEFIDVHHSTIAYVNTVSLHTATDDLSIHGISRIRHALRKNPRGKIGAESLEDIGDT